MDGNLKKKGEGGSAILQPKRKRFRLRALVKWMAFPFLILLLLPSLLYIPAVQDAVRGFVSEKVSEATGCQVSIGKFMLRFPLRLSVEELLVLDGNRDTIASGRELDVKVRILPLLKGDVAVAGLTVKQAYYRMVSADSSMTLAARLQSFDLASSRIALMTEHIDLSEASLSGADVVVDVVSGKEKTEPEEPSASSWLVTLDALHLENVRYRMRMFPAADSLSAELRNGDVRDVSVNMATRSVKAGDLTADGLLAAYLSAPAGGIAEGGSLSGDTLPPPPPEENPWTIAVRHFRLGDGGVLYAEKGIAPRAGLDVGYLQLSDVNIAVDGFYNRGDVLRVPITEISARERSGLDVKRIAGVFEMDGRRISAQGFAIETPETVIGLDAEADMAVFDGKDDAAVNLRLSSEVALSDVGRMMPELQPLWSAVGGKKAGITANLRGTLRELTVDELKLDIPKILSFGVKGKAENLSVPEKAAGKMEIKGLLSGGNYLKSALQLDSDVNIPVVRLSGSADYRRRNLAAGLSAVAAGGKIVLDGRWNISADGYRAFADLRDFNVKSFLPAGAVGIVDGEISAEGKGFDLYKMSAAVDADIRTVEYDSVAYKNVRLAATLAQGSYTAGLHSDNEFADLDLSLSGRIFPDRYGVKVDGKIGNLDLQAMKLSEGRLSGKMNIKGAVVVDPEKDFYGAVLRLSDMFVLLPENTFRTDSIDFGFRSDTLHTKFRMRNNDLALRFESPMRIETLGDSLASLMTELDSIYTAQWLDVDRIKDKLPRFELALKAEKKNIVHTYLAGMGIAFDNADLNLTKKDDLELDGTIDGLSVDGIVMDEVGLKGFTADGLLHYGLNVNNRLENSEFLKTAKIEGNLGDNRIEALLTQTDKADAVGFNFGMRVALADSVVTAQFFPDNPTIAFRDWQIAPGNYLSYNLPDGLIKADLSIKGGIGSYINLYTDKDGLFHSGINAELSGIELKDWLVMSPFAPPLEGNLSAKLKVNRKGKLFWGGGDVDIARMRYGKRDVGDVNLNAKLALSEMRHKVVALAGMKIDGRQSLTLKGYRDDSLPEPSYNMNLEIDKFPLKAAGAFIPEAAGEVAGFLNGKIKMEGRLENPQIDGYVQFDSAQVKMPAFGTSLAFGDARIPVENGAVKFNSFDLIGTNGSPVSIDGEVRLFPFDKVYTDLQLRGRNVQLVSGKKMGRSELYGKGFVDLSASLKGYLERLDLKATLSVLAGTNLTYVYQSGAVGLTEATDDNMVKFVNFSAPASVPDSSDVQQPLAMRIKAALIVQPNAVFTVNLSPDGKNKVQVDGEGMLSFSQNDQGDMSLIGRYMINDGFVRYSPPMMSEKLFKFKEGSNISWTGDLLNPALNVSAVQSMKVNVGGGNQGSRTVPFDVMLNVGNTLGALDVSFDLATEGDMAIANELSGMSKEQRATQAMNLLLYNTYTGSGGSSFDLSGGLSGNMAFSFLESVVNRWAANNISGVDLSFGIDQYDKTVDGTTSTSTSYSYQMSKSVFDDRFKIVVGGNYVSDASAEDNLAQNLLNDISFEYKLNKTGTAYVKLFHHKEFESILEGEVTETGAGFVWKRKIVAWREMFRFFRPRKSVKGKNEQIRND